MANTTRAASLGAVLGAAILVALAASGLVYGDDPEHTPVSLDITTNNPGCTTVFLSGYNLTRQTDLQYNYEYRIDDLRNGINMTFRTHADEAHKVALLLVERPAVSSVTIYSAGASPGLLAQYTNNSTYTDPVFGRAPCEIRETLLDDAVSSLRAADSGLATASDSAPNQSLVAGAIYTSNLAKTLEYLKEHGGIVSLVGEGRDGVAGAIEARVPVSLLVPLSNTDHFIMMQDLKSLEYRTTDNYGDVDTEGKYLTNANAWHADGYNGAGIRVGVIDRGFVGFDGTDELPSDTSFYCFRYNDQTDVYDWSDTDASFCYGDTEHGTAVAEILMDVAPAAELYIARIATSMHVNQAVEWMTQPQDGQGVDVIVMSLAAPFEGPGDGTASISPSALNAVNTAVDNGAVWINSAGNYANGDGWSVRNPQTEQGFIVFDTSTDITNRFSASAGEDVEVWLRWYDPDNDNTDLNLLVTGAGAHTSTQDQFRDPTLPPSKK